ncbi:hypothetical protein GGP63_002902 [Salinibacter ruber]|nr:hypothetical protein [Salinibacter ruber]MCS4198315.1 hypothetical protein [Salinibacter ruber]
MICGWDSSLLQRPASTAAGFRTSNGPLNRFLPPDHLLL